VNDNLTPDPSPAERGAGSSRCPVCGKAAAPASRPFCSGRCADVDLQRWLAGAYVVPAAEDEETAGDERL
jgi:uncharacterized protein